MYALHCTSVRVRNSFQSMLTDRGMMPRSA